MKYTKLGNTGVDVSRICLGCMSYGSSSQGTHDWALEEDESRPFIQQALD
ncbi:MAG TPA: alcohol dehydrogenase, partial [Acidimicrobiaceae bacterium]|nr:alcohol dehydrogenase [Acidimicrobiaceae bacterium]